MDREILFRAKFGNDWKYGYLSVEPKGLVIKEPYELNQSNIWHINPETVGQYTGLTDKNGTKIFEGDIVILRFNPCVVKWDTDNACYAFYQNGITKMSGFNADTMKLLEVIGNIHDDSDLLEVSE